MVCSPSVQQAITRFNGNTAGAPRTMELSNNSPLMRWPSYCTFTSSGGHRRRAGALLGVLDDHAARGLGCTRFLRGLLEVGITFGQCLLRPLFHARHLQRLDLGQVVLGFDERLGAAGAVGHALLDLHHLFRCQGEVLELLAHEYADGVERLFVFGDGPCGLFGRLVAGGEREGADDGPRGH
jgi:hypothetical protein